MTGGRKTGDYQPSVTKISDLVILVGLGLGWAGSWLGSPVFLSSLSPWKICSHARTGPLGITPSLSSVIGKEKGR